MTTVRRFSILDVYEYSHVNGDPLTETFSDSFYGKYISSYPEYCISLFSAAGTLVAYLLGKVEGDERERDWHGHVTVG